MRLEHALEFYGTAGFSSALAEELSEQSHELPIEAWMDEGGCLADNAEVSINEVKDCGDQIQADADVYFDETIASSCADITRTSNYRAKVKFLIDMNTGDVECEIVKVKNTTIEEIIEMDFDERSEFDAERSDF